MEPLLKYVQDTFVEKKDFPDFSSGDTITVYYEIKEGDKKRTQFFKGVVIQGLVLLLLSPSAKCRARWA